MNRSTRPAAWISTTQRAAWKPMPLPKAPARARLGRDAMPLALSGQQHQQIEGFGGCFNELGWLALGSLRASQRDKVFRSLFDPREGCRFNIGRLPIGASDYAASWYSHNETEGDLQMRQFSIERDRRALIPYIRQALKLREDLRLFASPWSPPTWMKHPPVYNYGTMIWRKEILDAYALYFVKFVQAYQAEGIRIAQIHPQNEPLADQKFPSCRWTGRQLRDFIRDHLGPALARHKVAAEIWLGTLNTSDYDGFVNTVLSDRRALAHIAGVGVQWDGKGLIGRTTESYPQVRTMQTENECGDGGNAWAYAMYVFDLMRHYFVSGVNAYVYWNMVLPPGGASTWGWKQNSMITVDPRTGLTTWNHEFHVMKHFSRFVDAGAVRLGLRGAWTGNSLAFRNPDGGLVFVVRNPFEEPRGLSLDAGGKAFNISLPSDSINTLCVGSK